MQIADTFIPTAGVVGVLPVITYFFLVVTFFTLLGTSIFTLITLPDTHTAHRSFYATTAVVTLVAALVYYSVQLYYRDVLTELATVTDANDRQTFIRESFNALGQYRYLTWFIAAPLLLRQTTGRLNLKPNNTKWSLAVLLLAGSFYFFVSYIGHQQLSFDNEIQAGPKAIWGVIAIGNYLFILFMLNRFQKSSDKQTSPVYRQMALVISIGWGIYLVGYFLTLTPLDFNWVHNVLTLTDVSSLVGMSAISYRASGQSPVIN